jgi:hypothetical protein
VTSRHVGNPLVPERAVHYPRPAAINSRRAGIPTRAPSKAQEPRTRDHRAHCEPRPFRRLSQHRPHGVSLPAPAAHRARSRDGTALGALGVGGEAAPVVAAAFAPTSAGAPGGAVIRRPEARGGDGGQEEGHPEGDLGDRVDRHAGDAWPPVTGLPLCVLLRNAQSRRPSGGRAGVWVEPIDVNGAVHNPHSPIARRATPRHPTEHADHKPDHARSRRPRARPLPPSPCRATPVHGHSLPAPAAHSG